MLPVLIGVGVAVGIVALLNSESQSAKREWQSRRDDLAFEVSYQRKRIKDHYERSQNNVQFHHLVNEHYKSVQLANIAYGLLSNCQAIIDSHRDAIGKLKTHRNALKAVLDGATKAERKDIFAELAELKKALDPLYVELERYNAEKSQFLENVRGLNHETAHLKKMIRDTTGQKGREWYLRLEERKLARS